MTASSTNDDYTYRNQVSGHRPAAPRLENGGYGGRIRLLNGALQNTGNAIGQLAQFNADGTRRPPP